MPSTTPNAPFSDEARWSWWLITYPPTICRTCHTTAAIAAPMRRSCQGTRPAVASRKLSQNTPMLSTSETATAPDMRASAGEHVPATACKAGQEGGQQQADADREHQRHAVDLRSRQAGTAVLRHVPHLAERVLHGPGEAARAEHQEDDADRERQSRFGQRVQVDVRTDHRVLGQRGGKQVVLQRPIVSS